MASIITRKEEKKKEERNIKKKKNYKTNTVSFEEAYISSNSNLFKLLNNYFRGERILNNLEVTP